MVKRLTVLLLTVCIGLSIVVCSGNASQKENLQADAFSAGSGEPESSEAEEPEADSALPGHVITAGEKLRFPLGEPVPFPNYFIGDAYLSPLISNEEVFNLPSMFNVTFEAAARNNWHSHEGGQILMVTGGVGYYQEEGQPAQILREGDVVKIAPDVKHWHGATADSWFSHIAISTNPEAPATEWMESVEDEAYNSLVTEEFSGRADIPDNDENNEFLFAKGNELNMKTFNGTNYVARLIQTDDVFNMPGMMNVIFETGVINNWHSHAGGQVMIATDGIGFHQLRGQPVEILYPGDVAFCPPGEDHWHGAGPDGWFAHIAISSNPEQTGMEWLEPVTEEDYNTAVETLQSAAREPAAASNSSGDSPLQSTVSHLDKEEAIDNIIKLQIGDQTFNATLVENSSTQALKELLADGPITINMRDYGNMEKVGGIGTSLPANDEQITTEPGDLILFQGNSFVIYYAPNSWNFTRIGKIDDVTQEELKEILGSGDVTVTISL